MAKLGEDLAFSGSTVLEVLFGVSGGNAGRRELIGPVRPKLIIIPREWPFASMGCMAAEVIESTITGIAECGFDVKMVLFDSDSDHRYEAIKVNSIIYKAGNMAEVLDLIRNADIVMSARTHGVILARMLGVHAIGFEIEPKIKWACEATGATTIAIDADIDDVVSVLEAAIVDIENPSHEAFVALEKSLSAAEAMKVEFLRSVSVNLDLA